MKNIVIKVLLVAIVSDLLTKGQGKCGMICLNSSKDAIALYQKLGFKTKERYMIKQWD